MTIDEVKDHPIGKRILEAIEKVKSDGWTLEMGITIDRNNKSCCPLGAVAVANDYLFLHNYESFPEPARDVLGLSLEDALSFAQGFDMVSSNDLFCNHMFYDMGEAIRKQEIHP